MTKKEALNAIKDHPGYNCIDALRLDEVAWYMVETNCDVTTAVNEIRAGKGQWDCYSDL